MVTFQTGHPNFFSGVHYLEDEEKIADEIIMTLLQKCCAAIPFLLIITFSVGVEGDGFIKQFQDYLESSWSVLVMNLALLLLLGSSHPKIQF